MQFTTKLHRRSQKGESGVKRRKVWSRLRKPPGNHRHHRLGSHFIISVLNPPESHLGHPAVSLSTQMRKTSVQGWDNHRARSPVATGLPFLGQGRPDWWRTGKMNTQSSVCGSEPLCASCTGGTALEKYWMRWYSLGTSFLKICIPEFSCLP